MKTMKFKSFLIFALVGVLTFSSCNDDDDNNAVVTQPEATVDFGTAPSNELIVSGTVEVITENTVRYHVLNFTNDPYTVTVVETENSIVIVDLGPAPTFAAELRAYVDVINKPGDVIITHNHGDHYGGAGSFTDYDFYAESTVSAQLNASTSFTELYDNGVIAVTSKQTIGDLEFTFDKVSNAETGENGYVYNEKHSILFVGDLIYNITHPYLREYTPATGEDEINNWISGLNELKAEFSNYNYVFVGHNKYRTDISTVIEENITYLQDAQGLIKGSKLLTAGGVATTQQQVIDELQVLYPDYLVGGLELSLPDAFFPGDPGADWFIGGGLANIVIEVTSFNLNADVEAQVFQDRDAEIEEDFASVQPGFLKRLSGLDADGKYVVMVFWESLEDADASITAFGSDPTVADYFAMIDGNTFAAERYTFPNINFSMEVNNVIEITTFNINSDVDTATFEARDGEIEQDFASQQPGFIRRTSGKDQDGKYAVIVFWETLEDADNSIAAFGSDPSVADYFGMIDGSTFSALRFSI